MAVRISICRTFTGCVPGSKGIWWLWDRTGGKPEGSAKTERYWCRRRASSRCKSTWQSTQLSFGSV